FYVSRFTSARFTGHVSRFKDMGRLHRLSAGERRFFDENGYLLLEQFYSPEFIDRAREEMNRLLRCPEAPRVHFSREAEDGAADHPVDPDNPQRVWMIMDTPLAGDWWFAQFQEPRLLD